MTWEHLSRVAAVSVAACIVSSVAADPPCFRGVGALPGGQFWSRAFAVSADGRVVVGESSSQILEAFRWECGTMSSLGTLPDGQVARSAMGVSADGSVIVGGNMYRLFRWRDGVCTQLGWILPPLDSDELLSAESVSDDGMVIVGYSRHNAHGGLRTTATLWWNAFAAGLTDDTWSSHAYDVSADGLVIVGSFAGEACYWHDGSTTGIGTLPSGGNSRAEAVTPDGSIIVGRAVLATGVEVEAFRWEDGSMVGLGDLAGGDFWSWALDVSADGSIVVGWGKSDLGNEAFIWDDDNGMRNLREVLEDDFGLDLTGWVLREAQGISADATVVVGWGYNPSGHVEGWIARLPPEGGTCAGDLDLDGYVNLTDLSLLLASYGQDSSGDLDCDCATDLSDLSILLANYGTTCE